MMLSSWMSAPIFTSFGMGLWPIIDIKMRFSDQLYSFKLQKIEITLCRETSCCILTTPTYFPRTENSSSGEVKESTKYLLIVSLILFLKSAQRCWQWREIIPPTKSIFFHGNIFFTRFTPIHKLYFFSFCT